VTQNTYQVSPNQEIYEKNYSAQQLALDSSAAYDQNMDAFRFGILKQYGTSKDILDLGCGSGSYLIPFVNESKSAIGLDFSPQLLEAFRKKLGEKLPENLRLIRGDIRDIPLPESSIDFAFSFASLYHVPDPELYIAQISRVLRPGGIACLELGNFWSLNTLFSYFWHRTHGWAKPFHFSVTKMNRLIKKKRPANSSSRGISSAPPLPGPMAPFVYAPPVRCALEGDPGYEIEGSNGG